MLESLKFTGRLLKKRPLRSLLTIIQIAIGVWIVTTILTMNFQANDTIEATLDKFGGNMVRVYLEKELSIGDRMAFETGSFNEEDIQRLATESNNIESVFIYNNTWQTQLKANNLIYDLRGLAETIPEAFSALDIKILDGQPFTAQDVEQKNTVAMISQDISNQLFPNQSAVGQTIEVEAMFRDEFLTFEIIGVYEPIDPLLATMFQEATMLIPLESRDLSATYDFHYTPTYHELFIKSYPGAIDAAVEDAKVIFEKDDFQLSPYYLRDIGNSYMMMINEMSLFFGAMAFVAIIISSIGILSIMLVNVVERTREIGLRKALGATRSSIVRQILTEGVLLSIIGALFGIVASILSSNYVIDALFNDFLYQNITGLGNFHPIAALYACLMALVMAIIFGLYPAVQAARLPAVEGLRDS